MPKGTFVLNDETVVNSYGFRTRNSGINLERLISNPVMLDYHKGGNASVIGRWVNIRIEGTKLLADAEFDIDDPEAAKIAGKVERGYLKGASLGLQPIGAQPFEMQPDGIPDLVSSEGMEASVVSIPSNRAAIKLYATPEVLMNDEEIKLSVSSLSANFTPTNMNKIMLTAQTLVLLGLNNTENLVEVQASIELMARNFELSKKDLATAQQEIVDLKAKLTAFEGDEALKLVDEAINSKKLGADQRDAFLKLATTDFDSAKKLIESMVPRTDLGAEIKNPNPLDASKVKTQDDFYKLSLNEQLAFKANSPGDYKKLFNA